MKMSKGEYISYQFVRFINESDRNNHITISELRRLFLKWSFSYKVNHELYRKDVPVLSDCIIDSDNTHYAQFLIDEAQQYRKVLEFYASEKNNSHETKSTAEEHESLSKVVKDNGRKAREILNKFN